MQPNNQNSNFRRFLPQMHIYQYVQNELAQLHSSPLIDLKIDDIKSASEQLATYDCMHADIAMLKDLPIGQLKNLQEQKTSENQSQLQLPLIEEADTDPENYQSQPVLTVLDPPYPTSQCSCVIQ